MNRKNIGLLLDSLYDPYEAQLWRDISRLGQGKEWNVVCFALGKLLPEFRINKQSEQLFAMLNEANLDGILALSSTLGTFLSSAELSSFYHSLAPLPVVSVGVALRDFASIVVDNRGGMASLLSHLIRDHGYRRLAFIKGVPGNIDADTRFRSYLKALEEAGIPYDETLVVEGDFLKDAGIRAVETLIDERRVSFDVLIGANDQMALQGMKELMRRGYRIPEDLGVAGFDDIEESRCGVQPLTTVRQPMYEIASAAVELMSTQLKGKEPPARITLPVQLKPRRSCGCFLHTGEWKSGVPVTRAEFLSPGNLEEAKENFQAFFRDYNRKVDLNLWGDKILQHLVNTLVQGGGEKSYLLVLESIILQSVEAGIDALQWYPAVTDIFTTLKRDVRDLNLLSALNDLWKSSLAQVGNIAEYRFIHTEVDYRDINRKLFQVSEALRDVNDLSELALVVEKQLRSLGVGRFYLAQYSSRDDGSARLIIGYDEKGRLARENFKSFPREKMLPGGLREGEEPWSLILFPLHFMDNQFGYAVYQGGALEGVVFEVISMHLNSSLQSAAIFSKVRKQALALETEIYLNDLSLENTRKRLDLEQQERRKTLKLLKQKEAEIRLLTRQLEQKSRVDNLTNLYNREAVFDLLKREVNRTRRDLWRINQEEPAGLGDLPNHFGHFALMLILVTNLKSINRTWGLDVGDRILMILGEKLLETRIFRGEDIRGRFGGGSFVVIFPSTGGMNCLIPARRFLTHLEAVDFPFEIEVEVNIGISQYTPGFGGEDMILRRAELALEEARKKGPGEVVLYSQSEGELQE